MEAKILIVEDDIFTCENLKEILTKEDYQVEMAHSPEDAIGKVKNFNPDLILMDIDLKSNIDGIELASKINQGSSIPIMYLTDKEDERIIEKASNVHHAYYMSKPFNESILLSQVALVLKQSSNSRNRVTSHPNSIFVKAHANSTQKSKVMYNDIIYIEAGGAYCTLHVRKVNSEQLEKFMLSHSLRKALELLAAPCFVRVHKSYAVNIDFVEGIDSKDVIMYGKVSIVLGETYKDQLLERLNLA